MLTLTTCLYDIRKKEQSASQGINTLKEYLELSRHMLRVRLPMVVFTDEEEIVAHVCETREKYGLLDKTVVVRLPFEDTYFYKDLEILKQRMAEFEIVNWNRDKDTPLYVLLNNNKFDFLQRSMEINPFQTEFFLWMDMGIQHCTKATEEEWLEISETWPSFVSQDREHIHQLRIHTTTKPEDMSWKDYFRMIYHHVGGGLFGGHRDRVAEYIRLFRGLWHKIVHEEGWWQLDEAVMTILTETHPEKFRFFYGDYDGMLSNFIRSRKSFHLVLQTAQRHLDARKNDLADRVLSTLDFGCLVGTEYYEKALVLKVCCDYHVRGGRVSPMLADVLDHHDIPTLILTLQMNNIRYLADPCLAPFFAKWVIRNPANQWAWEQWQAILYRPAFQWVPLGSMARAIFGDTAPLPTDTIKDDPVQLLEGFQSQFASSPNPVVCSFYRILETTGNRVFFVWAHHGEGTGNEDYDRSVLAVHGFLRRNFPQLDFRMVCLYANRAWTLTPDPGVLVFSIETPHSLQQDTGFFHQVASRFLSLLSFKVLFLNHKNYQCGVYQYGRRLHHILQECQAIGYDYEEVGTQQEYEQALQKDRYNAVIYNYYPSTMPWLNQQTIRRTQENIGILHECEPTFFDKEVCIDPAAPPSARVYSLPRPLIKNIPPVENTCISPPFQDFVSYQEGDTPIFGTFGFGFTNKGFPKIVKMVNEQYDKAIIKMLITFAHYGGDSMTIQQISDACFQEKTKHGITLLICTEFVCEHDLLLFLQSNTMNLFLYDFMGGRGISSTIDYALSVRRPLGISDSYMFRNIYSDDICLYKNSIQKCMENSVAHCEKFLSLYSPEKIRERVLHILFAP